VTDTTFVFVLLGVAGVLFASGKVRLAVTALLVVIALMLSGVLTVGEAVSGFGDPIVILIAALFVVG
jgi:di/tricarboxylate transporter